MIYKFFRSGVAMCAALLLAITAQAEDAPDFSQLLAFARLSSVAYGDRASIEKELGTQGFVLQKFANVPGYAVAYYVARNDATKTQVIVVRGTSNMENALVDVAVQLMPDEKAGIKIHQGFSQSSSNVYQQVLPLLLVDYRIYTIGHSLGGAIANILAMYLDADKFKIEGAITFGQPKVTNVSGANKYSHLKVTRVVTPKDVVPLVPPFDPMNIMNTMNMDLYWHQGSEIVLLEAGEYAVLEGLKSMMRAGRFTNVVPDETNIQQHTMSEYLRRLRDKTANARQVPYDTSFRIPGWG